MGTINSTSQVSDPCFMSPIFLANLWDIGVAFYVGMGQYIGSTTTYTFPRDIVIMFWLSFGGIVGPTMANFGLLERD